MMILAVVMTVVAFGAKAQKWGATPEDSIRNITNYSLYNESYKQKLYSEAYTPWKQLITDLPKRHKNDYINGATILKNMINKAATAEEREGYIAELMALYDKRIENFGEKATNLARKALDLESIKRGAALQEYYGYYEAAMHADSIEHKLEASYVYKFFEATIAYVAKGYADSSLVVDNYDMASEQLDAELRKEAAKEQAGQKNRAEDYRKYQQNVEAAFAPYASCDQLVNIYTKKFEANPHDTTLLKKITKIMTTKKCTKSKLFFQATENLYAILPTPKTALSMGVMCLDQDKYSDAVRYLSDAVKGITDEGDLYKAYIFLGDAYMGQNSYSAARSSYYDAARLDPSKGDPYLKIAILYSKGHNAVPDNMGGASAYWAAYDKCARAKNVDPSCAENASKMMGQFAASFPKKDKAFELDLIDGQSFTVPGWIGESTVIRTRK